MKILSGGISSIQDLGRFGYRNLGINNGGVVDAPAARRCNMLVANEDDAALVEIAAGRWSAQCGWEQLAAVGGHGLRVWIDERETACWQPFRLGPGETLRIESGRGGYGYLAVHGGFRVTPVLGSRSTHLAAGFGGWNGRLLKAGDELPTAVLFSDTARKILQVIEGDSMRRNFRLSDAVIPDYSGRPFRFFAGHEFAQFSTSAQALLSSATFETSTQTNRMGARLTGSPLLLQAPLNMLSSAVQPGTMQVSPDGQLLILLSDAQTTGGYPRIGQLAEADLHRLAQCGPGTKIRFEQVSPESAFRALMEEETQFRQLKQDYLLYFS